MINGMVTDISGTVTVGTADDGMETEKWRKNDEIKTTPVTCSSTAIEQYYTDFKQSYMWKQ